MIREARTGTGYLTMWRDADGREHTKRHATHPEAVAHDREIKAGRRAEQ
ncbi:hypothetical protein [Corynebacterium glyciniphilum]|nr:hypothetical protein [Corynebacterium glyciniphilum]MDN6706418.1 hypothetical protein [Corynebacterium glyciniphilum]